MTKSKHRTPNQNEEYKIAYDKWENLNNKLTQINDNYDKEF